MNPTFATSTPRFGALVSALLLSAATGAHAQGLSPGAGSGSISQGAARPGQPALNAPANPAAGTPQPGSSAPTTPTPLPGQSTMGNPLPPMNATGVGGQTPLTAPPGSVPSRAASASEAFSLLDRGQVGYVTRADTDRIPGFVGFDNADTNRDGQLTKEEFANAWRYYSGQ